MGSSPFGMKRVLMVVPVLVFLIPIQGFAEPPFYVMLKPGTYFPTSRGLDGYDPGFSEEIAFGYRFKRNIAAEVGIGYFKTQGKVTGKGATDRVREEFDLLVFPATLTLKAILPYKKWELFGLGGTGVYLVSGPHDFDDYDDYLDHDYDFDAVWGGYLGGGLHYNLTPKIFVGVEGKYLWTDRAKLGDEVRGIRLEANFRMDGIITAAVIGVKF